MTSRPTIRAASASVARRRGAHALTPEHLGDATAAATLAVIVGGIALIITAIGMIAMALTIGARFGSEPPPNVGSLAILPIEIGIGVLLLGGALAVGGVAVLADAPRARPITGALAALAAGLAALGTVAVMTLPPPAPVIAIALTVAALVFGIAALLLLLRPRR